MQQLSALRWHGLLPERIAITQSMTVETFKYTCANREASPLGCATWKQRGQDFIITSPEKALCDLIITTSGVNLRYREGVRAYLEDNLKLDMDVFRTFDLSMRIVWKESRIYKNNHKTA